MRALLLAVAIGLLASEASAQRSFTRSRDWVIPHVREVEVEWRSFADTRAGQHLGQLELAYGFTRNFALEVGVEFEQREEQEADVESANLEARLSLGEFAFDEWLPALNVEYEHPNQTDAFDGIEARFVLSRYREDGRDLTLNFVVEREVEGDEETELAMTGGFLMPFCQRDETARWYGIPRFGLEAVWGIDERTFGLGPLVAYRAGEHVNLLASYTFAFGDPGEVDVLAFILELEF